MCKRFFIYLFIYFSPVRNKSNEIHVLTLLHSSTSFSVTVSFAISVGRGSKSCLNVQHMNRINFHYRKKYMNTFKHSQWRWHFHVLKRCLCYILAKNSQWLTTLSILPYLHHVTKQCFTDHHGPVSCTALQSCQTYRIFFHLKFLYRATSMTNTCRLSTVSAKWQLTSFVKLEYLYLGATFLSFCSMNKAQVCSPS